MNKTNNDILFECQLDILRDEGTPQTAYKIIKFGASYDLHNGKEVEFNFSHDNWTGVYCWLKVFDEESLRCLPLFGHHSLRPTNFFFFLYAKYPILGFPFLPIVSIAMIVSALRVWRGKGSHSHITTSGKLLTYFKMKAFNMRITKWFVDAIIDSTPEFPDGWKTVFYIYHGKDKPEIYKALCEVENGN